MPARHVIVIGGGLAGLAGSVALADKGLRVSLLEKRPRLGGRATSYQLPSGEYIDNCQHVTLRCCTNLDDFYRRIGASGKIQYYDRLVFADKKGRRGEIRSRRLPAPFHVAQAFSAFPLLNWRDKRAIATAMLRIMRSGGRLRTNRELTMLEWLQQNKQPPEVIERFWRVVLVSALNEQLDRTDAAYGIAVFWKAFLSNPDGFGMGVPLVPLEQLYASTAAAIEACGGEVRTRCGVVELILAGNEVSGVRLDDGTELAADYFVAALPFDRLPKILPEAIRGLEPFRSSGQLTASPITSVHFWFDRPVMTEPFVASLDHTIQWVFNKMEGNYLQVVISASHELTSRTQQDILAICRNDLESLIPATRDANLTRSVVIRENSATFSPQPGCDRLRPSERTPLRNLFLAGDWTSTGWPATMEGAVRSGYRAAEAILLSEGENVHLVLPELPATGLARLLAGI